MAETNVSRTKTAFKKRGIPVDVCERFIQNGKFGFRKDLFGLFDLMVIDVERRAIIGVQVGSLTDRHDHLRKIMKGDDGQPELANAWLSAGGEIEVWSWRKMKVKRGGKAVRWVPKIDIISLDADGTLVTTPLDRTGPALSDDLPTNYIPF